MAIFPKGKKLEQFQKDLAADTVSGTAPTNVTAQAVANHTRKQWEEYQRQMQIGSITSDHVNIHQARPTAERIIISTEEFMAMPIQSMEELMTVLTTRLRLTGTVLEEDGKLTVTIDQKSKEVTIEARNPYRSPVFDEGMGLYPPGMTASGLSLLQQQANLQASMLAHQIDKEIIDQIMASPLYIGEMQKKVDKP